MQSTSRLFTFALPLEHEMVSLRAAVQGKGTSVRRPVIAAGRQQCRSAQWWANSAPTWTGRR